MKKAKLLDLKDFAESVMPKLKEVVNVVVYCPKRNPNLVLIELPKRFHGWGHAGNFEGQHGRKRTKDNYWWLDKSDIKLLEGDNR